MANRSGPHSPFWETLVVPGLSVALWLVGCLSPLFAPLCGDLAMLAVMLA